MIAAKKNVPRVEELVAYLKSIHTDIKNYRAVHIYLSRLQPTNRDPAKLKSAHDNFSNLIQRISGKTFYLLNGDIIYLTNSPFIEDIKKIILRFKWLFSGDPIARDTQSSEQFYIIYGLDRDYSAFVSAIHRIVKNPVQNMQSQPATSMINRGIDGNASKLTQTSNSMTADCLLKLQNILNQADLSNFLRHQAICKMIPGGKPEPVAYEYYITIQALQDSLFPEYNILGNPWLFRHLTMILDKRVLVQIQDILSQKHSDTIHLNLNLRTILSQQIYGLEREMINHKKKLTLEIDHIDLLAHADAYSFSREIANQRQFKLCLDGLNISNLSLFNFNAFDIDMLKIVWSSDFMKEPYLGILKSWKEKKGAESIIFTHCETEEAIMGGQELGFLLFQGLYIEGLLARIKQGL